MWKGLTDLAKSAAAMLYSGYVPPNTPVRYKEDLSKINFLTSKKFYIVFCSVIILAVFYVGSIAVLFLTASSPSLTVPFVTIFTETIKILAIIIASYLGVQTVLDYKMQSNSNVELQGSDSFVTENVDKRIVERFAEKYKTDLSYAPLEWIEERSNNDE